MNRLRAYRHIEDINQKQLGELLGISAQMVGAIESGRRRMSANLSLLGYSGDRIDLPDMSPPLHRHRASTLAANKKRAHELMRLAGEVFKELRSMTSKTPPMALEKLPPPQSASDIEELAIEVRCMLGHEESGPIQNLTAAVERAGVCLVPISGLDGIDGLSAWVEDVPVIGMSPNAPGDRFRLTLAHELGHLLFHHKKTDTTESEANQFAGALLFPLEEFDAAMPERPNLRDFISLKASWGVSVAALVYRAHELDYVPDDRYRALQIQMAKWRKKEPGTFDAAHGALLPRMMEVNGGVAVLSEELGINQSHLATLTNWSRPHLRLAAIG